MSDYDDYDADYGNDDDYQEDEVEDIEDVQANLEIQYFNTEELLRNGDIAGALQSFQDLFDQAETHNLRNWKVKIVVQIMEIHAQKENFQEVRKCIGKIKGINETDKLTQTAVKSIINLLQKCPKKQYESYWEDLFSLIESLDENGVIKSYMVMLDKQISDENKPNSTLLFGRLKNAMKKTSNLNSGFQLELYSLEIKYLKLQGKNTEVKLREIKTKLPQYEEETHVNDSHISFLKEQIAALLYEEGNYVQCTNYLCSSFCQNAKFGKNSDNLKELLKVNVIVLLLCEDSELLQKKQYNPMLHESTSTFKMDQDIQALFGLIEAFKNLDIERFQEIFKVISLHPAKNSLFFDIHERILFELKKKKVEYITKPYKKITFDYIKRRIHENEEVVIDILFQLINDKKINGKIYAKEKFVEIIPELSSYFKVQLENLQELSIRL